MRAYRVAYYDNDGIEQDEVFYFDREVAEKEWETLIDTMTLKDADTTVHEDDYKCGMEYIDRDFETVGYNKYKVDGRATYYENVAKRDKIVCIYYEEKKNTISSFSRGYVSKRYLIRMTEVEIQ